MYLVLCLMLFILRVHFEDVQPCLPVKWAVQVIVVAPAATCKSDLSAPKVQQSANAGMHAPAVSVRCEKHACMVAGKQQVRSKRSACRGLKYHEAGAVLHIPCCTACAAAVQHTLNTMLGQRQHGVDDFRKYNKSSMMQPARDCARCSSIIKNNSTAMQPNAAW